MNQEINDEIESENKKLKNQVNILKFIDNTFKNSKYIEKVCQIINYRFCVAINKFIHSNIHLLIIL